MTTVSTETETRILEALSGLGYDVEGVDRRTSHLSITYRSTCYRDKYANPVFQVRVYDNGKVVEDHGSGATYDWRDIDEYIDAMQEDD